jgi:hypothetical protein
LAWFYIFASLVVSTRLIYFSADIYSVVWFDFYDRENDTSKDIDLIIFNWADILCIFFKLMLGITQFNKFMQIYYEIELLKEWFLTDVEMA